MSIEEVVVMKIDCCSMFLIYYVLGLFNVLGIFSKRQLAAFFFLLHSLQLVYTFRKRKVGRPPKNKFDNNSANTDSDYDPDKKPGKRGRPPKKKDNAPVDDRYGEKIAIFHFG